MNKKDSPSVSKFEITYEVTPVKDFAYKNIVPEMWVNQQNSYICEAMRHLTAIAELQKPEHSAERDVFYNALFASKKKEMTSEEDANNFLSDVYCFESSGKFLKSSCPNVYKKTQDIIDRVDINKTLKQCKIKENEICDNTKRSLKINQAFACAWGGESGLEDFKNKIKKIKKSTAEMGKDVLSSPRTALAISAAIFSAAIVTGAGPYAIIVGAAGVLGKFMRTKTGKKIQQSVYSSTESFLESAGVPKHVTRGLVDDATRLWEKTFGTRWGKFALLAIGVAAAVISGDAPEASKKTTEAIHNAIDPSLAGEFCARTSVMSAETAVQIDRAYSGIVSVLPATTFNYINAPYSDMTGAVKHTVQAGETLTSIAQDIFAKVNPGGILSNERLHEIIENISLENSLEDPNFILPGQQLSVSELSLLPQETLNAIVNNQPMNLTEVASTYDSFYKHDVPVSAHYAKLARDEVISQKIEGKIMESLDDFQSNRKKSSSSNKNSHDNLNNDEFAVLPECFVSPSNDWREKNAQSYEKTDAPKLVNS